MLNKMVFVGLFLSVFCFKGIAQSQYLKHPIDKKYDACLEKKPMRECIATAYEAWDAELNKVYKQLLANAKTKSGTDEIKNAQRQWMLFRDAEFKALSAVYGYIYDQNDGGTMYSDIGADARISTVRNRAVQISDLEEDLKETGLDKPIHELYPSCSGKDQKSLSACITKAYEKSDADLNEYYKKLLAATKDKSLIEAVKNAQRQWLVLRDAEFKNLKTAYAYLGSKNKKNAAYYQQIEAHSRAKFVRDRVLELSSQFGNLEEFTSPK